MYFRFIIFDKIILVSDINLNYLNFNSIKILKIIINVNYFIKFYKLRVRVAKNKSSKTNLLKYNKFKDYCCQILYIIIEKEIL